LRAIRSNGNRRDLCGGLVASQTVPVHARKTNPCKTFEVADDGHGQDDVAVLATHVNIVQYDGGDSKVEDNFISEGTG